MNDIRTLFAPLTKPVGTWIKRCWLRNRINVWQADIEVMDRIDLDHREAKKYRHYQIAEANSRLQRLYR